MNQTNTIPPVIHDASERRFEIRIGTGPTAFLSYTFGDDLVIFEHTEVPAELRGQGLAAHLARAALNEARQRHWRIIPRCEYVAGFIARHREFADLIAPSNHL
jgi:predicted GNAT family acetyltransferase